MASWTTKGMATAALCSALAGCGRASPEHEAQVVDTLIYGGGYQITVLHDAQRHVTCWKSFAAMSCLPDVAVAGGGK